MRLTQQRVGGPCGLLRGGFGGVAGRSAAAKAARWNDRLQLVEVEIGDRLQPFSQGTVLLIVRQGVEPCGILRLQLEQDGDRIVPAAGAAAMIEGTARADNRLAGGAR